ncbi:MAG: hypothetical protein UW46_C0001G0087 [Candidatus Yanofskybacteria bacterium GW2011_GWF1_44_227]|uniref:DUF4232 domain-containing protein n=1 Tax=Candidatus Yanofskybacteria bacterium GW2011_GWE2_40_11 TaxID=1619033 RepID=A0A0G0QLY5_9BACT|nr:MAG: hypothetical protein UT75_C0001G0017 [Candidatus Yanofskybacteria bacterium GW2011_GWE2_40_11]KKT15889.1 MAG: hypothetical protein UV97_C0001G0062 [Candidatus Yanofskybacteria bacterium GW2011_GWF2_43_596]KKT53597.1 MAG: hypothetical protein UW46_C0001G0087 [Candidatus Yanofskybacteria bacterium GW2011_GWF1_44_227]OGN36275.1 MAG: hypothetical protein A2241_00850 [Candidatus Yanofskybacteria bacterium RIFOXYA2_FULL_45_28]OGN36991.1 MAG: hypothetical protein A2207_01500 [Candidatus Yanofs
MTKLLKNFIWLTVSTSIASLIIGLIAGFYYRDWKIKNIAYCLPEQISAEAKFEGAAGNIFGTFIIKNNSENTCQIDGKTFVEANFDKDLYTNINLINDGLAGTSIYVLKPQESVYAAIHIPNGPQCSSKIRSVPTTFSYAISPDNSIIFNINNQAKKEFLITACGAAGEFTDVSITNLSDQTSNQQ